MRFIPRRRWAVVFPVTPATLLACSAARRRRYEHEQTALARRPATVRCIARLAVRLAKENRSGDTGYSWELSQALGVMSRRPLPARSCALGY